MKRNELVLIKTMTFEGLTPLHFSQNLKIKTSYYIGDLDIGHYSV